MIIMIEKIRNLLLKLGFVFVIATFSAPAVAQRSCSEALIASGELTAALLSRDTVVIKALVDPAIGYGHSNGWIESRAEMCSDLYDGTLQYHNIRLLDAPTCILQKRSAVIRQLIAVAIAMKDAKLEMNLAVLQVWKYRCGRWTLIARQSCKIS